jgi:hypothetical protein
MAALQSQKLVNETSCKLFGAHRLTPVFLKGRVRREM